MAESLDADDVLFQMKLKYWDEPLDYTNFKACIRRIDPTFSEPQCRALFNKIKNQVEVVEIPVLIQNLCGTLHDTVDYKNKMYLNLYNEIFAAGRDGEFLMLLEQDDFKSDGKIRPDNLERVIFRMTNNKYTELEVRKLVR